MKIEELENYYLQVTEKHIRYYYSIEPQILSTETINYNIVVNSKITTSVAPIKISSLFSAGDEIYGIYLEYYDNNSGKFKTVELNFDSSIEISLTEGNNDIWRTSLCTLKIVEK